MVFEPQEFLEKPAALVPPPRFHLARYHGIFGPCASERDRIVPAGRVVGASHEGSGGVTGRSGERGSHSAAQPLLDGPAAAVGGGVVEPVTPASDSRAPLGPLPGRGRRLAWAELLRRVFAVDVLECPRCGGRMRLLAAIHPPEATRAILECLGLPSRAPPACAPLPEDDSKGAGSDSNSGGV